MLLDVATSIGLYSLIVFGNLKTDNIMANVRFVFSGTEKSETDLHDLECYLNTNGEIYISLDIKSTPPSWICLDISTAIKLHKTLRSVINEAKEVNNG